NACKKYVSVGVFLFLMLFACKSFEKNRGIEVSVSDGMSGEEKTEAPRVALTFDDGPDCCYTVQMLKGLREREVKATFFLQGQCLEGNEYVVQQMQKDGHLIGNHTYHHVQLTKLSDDSAKKEITETSNAIYEITGEYPIYIRPPYGAWKEGLDLQVTMIPVLWTIDSRDWETQNTAEILQAVLPKVEDGSIILMHDGYRTSVEAALRIVDELKDEGYQFVTVDRLIEE
ncbi:MAG: polysaccharide deacetylase family protein, partial [Fusicatenibacter sp.]|nr:polysaccharide deacetylase family protein [Fusicatenibacter sp.]